MNTPLVVGPFIELRRSDHRPQKETTDETQEKDVHVAGCPQVPQ